jgi:hypothetical protein
VVEVAVFGDLADEEIHEIIESQINLEELIEGREERKKINFQ